MHVNPLPAPFDQPPEAAGVAPLPQTVSLVQTQIDALLQQTPSFYALTNADREKMRNRLTRIGAYAAELVRDDWAQSLKLGQTPLIRREKTYRSDTDNQLTTRSLGAQAELQTAATGRVAGITQSTLQAIAFPTFVADLINGTFDAIIGATIKQMEAFQELVANVSKSVNEFMRDNITDNQARDYLAQSYPELLRIEVEDGQPKLTLTEAGENAEQSQVADMQGQLSLPDPVTSLDEEVITETLIPAARRKLAQSRLQMLSSMVMMGLQRIVIRHGRLRATMGFHIDASDRAHAEEASTFDFNHQNSVQGIFYVAFSARTSVAYVRSTQSDSDSAINVQADLTGEVDLTFETDYLPLNRLARAESIEKIRQNTPNPEANQPVNQAATTTQRSATNPSAAQVVSGRIAAHAAQPSPTIANDLVDTAVAAGRSAPGAAGAAVRAVAGSGESSGSDAASSTPATTTPSAESTPEPTPTPAPPVNNPASNAAAGGTT